jgi:hypothetical protein
MDKPSEVISDAEAEGVYGRALDEATEYMPVLGLARYRGYTIGTRAAHFEPGTNAYTSKAIVFENFGGVQNYHAVLGGKVSCMFDISKDVKAIVS